MSKQYKLKSAIDASTRTDGDDVIAVKSALNGIGYYNSPEWGITGYPDTELFDSIGSFQADHGLKHDRIMKPGGETERELAARSPTYWCTKCGGPHGGVYGPICPKCWEREQNS